MWAYLQAPRTLKGKSLGYDYLNSQYTYPSRHMVYGWVESKYETEDKWVLRDDQDCYIYIDKSTFKCYTKYYKNEYYYANVKNFTSKNPKMYNRYNEIKDMRLMIYDKVEEINELNSEKKRMFDDFLQSNTN